MRNLPKFSNCLFVLVTFLLVGRSGALAQPPSSAATFTYPTNGATNVPGNCMFQWASGANAESYYLYVGTTQGAKDVVNSGGLSPTQTSYQAAGLPAGQTLYGRMWTQIGGNWLYSDISFTTAPIATLTYPGNGATKVPGNCTLQWTHVANAQSYYLYVGTKQGAKDIVNTGAIKPAQTSYQVTGLPAGQTLYARIWTQTGGKPYSDTVFTTEPRAYFTYPRDGAMNVDPSRGFSWTAVPSASAYYLYVGTSPGAKDVVNSGGIQQTSYPMTGFPAKPTLYARIYSQVAGAWIYSEVMFTLAPSVPPATIIFPTPGAVGVSTAQAFQWTAVDIARGYILQIGSLPGGKDLHDSGEIRVTQRFVPNLPTGVPLYGRIKTKLVGQWYARDFTFSVANNSTSMGQTISTALYTTDFVRSMADIYNNPHAWATLWVSVYSQGKISASCGDYSQQLLSSLGEVNIQTGAQMLSIDFDQTNGHQVIEMLNTDDQTWMLLDPTFDLTVKRASDGRYATAEDMSSTTHAQAWNQISYVLLGLFGDSIARSNYLDYPLLYNNLFRQGAYFVQTNTALPYLREVPLPASGPYSDYLVGCSQGTQANVVIDGEARVVTCYGMDALSVIFPAQTVSAGGGGAFNLYQPMRYVF